MKLWSTSKILSEANRKYYETQITRNDYQIFQDKKNNSVIGDVNGIIKMFIDWIIKFLISYIKDTESNWIFAQKKLIQ